MSISANIIAALCAKANDAAFANEISIAAGRVTDEQSLATNKDNGDFIASLCAKASAFHLDDVQSPSSVPRAPACFSLHQASPQHHDADNACAAGSVSTTGHNISDMEPQDMIVFARSIVTTPDGFKKPNVPFPPATVLMSGLPLDEVSTTSSLTDGIERPKSGSNEVLHSISTDELLEALGKKLSAAMSKSEMKLKDKIDRLINEEVSNALANMLALQKGKRDMEGQNRKHDTREKAPLRKTAKIVSRGRTSRGNNPTSPSPKIDKKFGVDSVISANNSPVAATDDENNFDSTSRKSAVSTATDKSIPSDKDLLAIGWKKALDSKTGRYYYYKLDWSEVVWDNPLTNWGFSEQECFDTDQFDEIQFFESNPFSIKRFKS